jgi:hypothetical protein
MKILSIITVLLFKFSLFAQTLENYVEKEYDPERKVVECEAVCVLKDGSRRNLETDIMDGINDDQTCREELERLCKSLSDSTANNSNTDSEVTITAAGCNRDKEKLERDHLSVRVIMKRSSVVVSPPTADGYATRGRSGECKAVCSPGLNVDDEEDIVFEALAFNLPEGLRCSTKTQVLAFAANACYVTAHKRCESELKKRVNKILPDPEVLEAGGYLPTIEERNITNVANENIPEELLNEKVDASDDLGFCKIGHSKEMYYGNGDDVFNPILEKYCYCHMGLQEEGVGEFSEAGFNLVQTGAKYRQCVNMACYVNNNSDATSENLYEVYRAPRVDLSKTPMTPSDSGVTFNQSFCSDRQMNQWFRDYRRLQKDREKGLAEKVDELCSISASSDGDNKKCRKELSDITKVLFKEDVIDSCTADFRNNDTHRAEHSCEDLKSYEKILGASVTTPFESICRGKNADATDDELNACGLEYTQALTNSYFETELAKCNSPKLQSADSVKTCQNLVLENIISHSTDDDVAKMAQCVDLNKGNKSAIKLCVGDVIVNSIASETLLKELKDLYCTAKRDDAGNIYKYLNEAEQKECLHTLLIHNTADLSEDLKKCLNIEDVNEKARCQRDILVKAIVEDRRFDVEACWEYPLTVSNPYRNENVAKRANPFDKSRMDRNMCVDLSKHVSYEAQICEAKTSAQEKINCFSRIKPQALAKSYLARKIGRMFKACDEASVPEETQNLCAKKTAFEQCKKAPEPRQMNCLLNMMDEAVVAKIQDTNKHCLEEANPDQCFQAANLAASNGLVPDPSNIAAFTTALSSTGNTTTNPSDGAGTSVTEAEIDDETVTAVEEDDAEVVAEADPDGNNDGINAEGLFMPGVLGAAGVVLGTGNSEGPGSGTISMNNTSPESLGNGRSAGQNWDTVNNASRYDDSGATGLFKDTKYMGLKDTNPNSQACSKLKKASIIRFGGLLTSVGVGVTAGVMAMKAMKKDENGQRNAMKAMTTMAVGATAAVGVKLLANLWARRVVEGAITDETLRRQQDPSSMMISTCTTRSERKKATSFYFDQEEFKVHDFKKLDIMSVAVLNQIDSAKDISEVNSIFKEWDEYYHGYTNVSEESYEDFFNEHDLNDKIGLEEIKFIVMNSIQNTMDKVIPSAHAKDESKPVDGKTQGEIMKELTGQIDPKVKNIEQMDSLVLLIDYGEVIGVDTTAYTKRGIDLKKREIAVENLSMKTVGQGFTKEVEAETEDPQDETTDQEPDGE